MNNPATTDVYNIYFSEEHQAVVMDWDGYATSKQFKEGTEKMLEVLAAYSVQKVLADVKDMVLISTEDQRWLETNFLPRAVAKGFRAIAIVKPVSYFNAVAIESVSFKVKEHKILMNVFDSLEEAKHWLDNLVLPVETNGDANNTFHVYFDAPSNTVVMHWRGYATSKEFREKTELMLQTLVDHRAKKVLANVKDMVMTSEEDQRWIEHEFLPRAQALGFEGLAIIKPTHYFNAVAMESVAQKVFGEKMKIGIFDTQEEAEHWLASLPF